MAEFIIYETKECFKVLPSDQENDERKWGECDISYSYVKEDKGIIGIRFYKLYNTGD